MFTKLGLTKVDTSRNRRESRPTTGRFSTCAQPDDPGTQPARHGDGRQCCRWSSCCLFAPVRRVRPNGQMFFLGAGFMLLETKGVVHMALLFGATWMVNSIVFFAILTMILLSNLFVLAVQPVRLWPYYALLVAALWLNSVVPMADFLALPGHEQGRSCRAPSSSCRCSSRA